MESAKSIWVKPIRGGAANEFIKRCHYSGKVCQNSQIHLGVFDGPRLEGVAQFGTSIDKRKMLPLVRGTRWNGYLELNRLAFSDALPRNSESRALSIMFRIIRKRYPFIKWVVSFADACQCGDGAIYRASGFILAGIKKNTDIVRLPDGTITNGKTLNDNPNRNLSYWRKRGAKPLTGFQVKYIYFLDPTWRERLTVPEIPFSRIRELGAAMYKGKRGGSSTVERRVSSPEMAVQIRPPRSISKGKAG